MIIFNWYIPIGKSGLKNPLKLNCSWHMGEVWYEYKYTFNSMSVASLLLVFKLSRKEGDNELFITLVPKVFNTLGTFN